MVTVQIECIDKPDPFNRHERIRRVGGRTSEGVRVSLTLDEAVAGIKNNTYKFWVAREDPRKQGAWVEVESIAGRKPFLKTVPDNTPLDNLLYLPQCPR
jgi:hypothetical protein